MTITTTTNQFTYTGDGSSTAFAYGAPFIAATDLKVYVNGVLQTSGYSVSPLATTGGSGTFPSGTVNFAVAPAALATILIYCDPDQLQSTSLPPNDPFPSKTVEKMVDKVTLLVQRLVSRFARAIIAPDGESGTSLTLPSAAARANNTLSFDSSGNVVTVAPSSGSSAALAADLVSTALAAKNAGQVGFNGTLNYVGQTIGKRLIAIGADPRSLGAPADGVGDDSPYWTAALLYSKTLDVRNGTWKLNSTISCIAGLSVDARGATVTLNTGATPGLQQLNGNAGLTIHGGFWQGTASAWLFLQGKTATPAAQTDYASLINLYNVQVSSATITNALQFDRAVKSFSAVGCNFFTLNGVISSAAAVEITFENCICYGATGAAGTRGVQLRSTGGTTFYSQGWSFIGGTWDNFEIVHDVTDVFAYQVVGGYHGVAGALSATTGYTFSFQAPLNTSLTDTIDIGGGVEIGGRIRFLASAGGQAYNAKIDAHWIGVPGTAVAIENNAANISVKGDFKACGGGTGVAVVGSNNNANIATDVWVDSTYTNGVILNGANGANCFVDAHGPCTGDIVGAGRANIRYGAKVPLHSTAVVNLMRTVSAANLGAGATYIVGANIASIAWAFARGEKGFIEVRLPYSGAAAATQNVQIGVPAGMVLDSGTGYSGGNLYLGAAAGRLSDFVPYTCTADGSGNVTVLNQAGNTLTVANQGYCGVRRQS